MNSPVKNISIIIPCFNTPVDYLKEAIESVKKYSGRYSYEIIIVDDGSTNEPTIQFLKTIPDKTIQIITQKNKGLAGARNTGIKNSSSNYLLFLDSDDRLKPEYIDKGMGILLADKKTGVVYANADAFGDGSRENFIAESFDIATLLIKNYIPSCAVIRKEVWENAGGFDENLRRYEDWEFWVNVYKTGWQFKFIDEPLFEYRIHDASLLGKGDEKEFKKAIEYIYKKHWDLVYQVFHQLYANRIMYNNDMQRPLRSFIKFSKKKFLN